MSFGLSNANICQRFSSVYKTMLSYCLKCRKNTKSRVAKRKIVRVMLLSKCAVCDNKKLKLIKQQEASGLLSSFGINTPLNKIVLLGPLLF